MAFAVNQHKTISKHNAGFPDYLDFDRLRREGIDYLGRLSGKLWTDHNVHDPGITILEMLCYALLDLGYRTNLPVADILSPDPNSTGPDDNFFTPAHILTNNPLTITDFRKLLIDIPGVKNAWLEVARDYHPGSFCSNYDTPTGPNDVPVVDQPDPCCDEFVNGLYRVYLDLENSVYTDPLQNVLDEQKKQEVLQQVKNTLLQHRNFCEDFYDIRIFCKLETGVCADIELEDQADPEAVYLQLTEALYQFFSPAPRFYTLPQMLEKGKTMEEIFAGRASNLFRSHGFVDTEELQQIKLRKEIHLSDVYSVLLGVKGVSRVQHLRLRRCGDANFMDPEKWKFVLPENHVPEFSIKCSGFRFLRRGVPVPFNFKQYEALIALNSVQQGKVLYTERFPYLDSAVPQGMYRRDLDDYYSIQNEFPRVYGIGEGGLPDSAPAHRQAQALQLKGYLLFFDQLLANYLSQLKNIRSLFAMKHTTEETKHTYFVNQLNTVPDLDKLLRFTAHGAAASGATLAFPVNKEWLLQQLSGHNPCGADIEQAQPFHFSSLDKVWIAMHQLQEDFYHGQYQTHIVNRGDDCIFYYITTSSDCFVLLGKKYYSTPEEARLAAESLTYVGGFEENYHTYIAGNGQYASFEISFNLSDYKKYLQYIAEDTALFYDRRRQFLDHLLARFAAQFTDFATAAYTALNQQQEKSIQARERYLSEYPDLSANRGKAYHYGKNGWNTDNISGFEKRVKLLSGMQHTNRRSLCNFEVVRYRERYTFQVPLDNALWLNSHILFQSPEAARAALRSLMQAARQEASYRVEPQEQGHSYSIAVEFETGKFARFTTKYATPELAWQTAHKLRAMFSPAVAADDIIPDTFQYTAQLTDAAGNMLLRSLHPVSEEAAALQQALKHVTRTTNAKWWSAVNNGALPALRLSRAPESAAMQFINTDAFRVDIDNNIVGKPDKYAYEMLDKNNQIKFRSVDEFDSEKAAQEHYMQLLWAMMEDHNFHIAYNSRSASYTIEVRNGDLLLAESFSGYESVQAANEALETTLRVIRDHLYHTRIQKEPASYKFLFRMGYEPGEAFVFNSVPSFATRAAATQAAVHFTENLHELHVEVRESTIILRAGKKGEFIEMQWQQPENAEDIPGQQQRVLALASMQKNIASYSTAPDDVLNQFIDTDAVTKTGLYVYRLVDKDNLYAFSTIDSTDKTFLENFREENLASLSNRYNWLDLQVKGNITCIRKDATNGDWYHFQLRSVNAITKPNSAEAKPLVLFESTKGYTSREAAEEAFAAYYWHILRLAMEPDNYRGGPISTTELLYHTTAPPGANQPLVFVPKETLDFLGDYEERAVEALIKVVKSYPLRTIYPKKECREFRRRFDPCNETPCQDETAVCPQPKETPVWYFVLFNKEADREEWQSVQYFSSAEEARRQFEMFLLLLKHPGNYHIECTCRNEFDENTGASNTNPAYRIFIREVLAESARRFATEEEAWGAKGVQHFIEVAQTSGAFHQYATACCYSFYVACANKLVYHPCRYDTPEQRDQAMALLYRGMEELRRSWRWFPGCEKHNSLLIRDFSGNEIATLRYANNEGPSIIANAPTEFDWYTAVMHLVATRGLCIENETVFLKGKSIAFIPANADMHPARLKEILLWLSQWYPFVLRIDQSGRVQYCLELKLPGFNGSNINDCSATANDPLCHVAWKSNCCYNNCQEALSALQNALRLLSRYEHYRAIFDCDCHSYGIAIHYENSLPGDQCGYPGLDKRPEILPCEHAIAAYNPQCYTNAEMACQAAARAVALINSEGLHVVEHILLRPRCPEHCRCRLLPCRNEWVQCAFPSYQSPASDPCNTERPVCFRPGYDPYSFIATVVLPAWPQRFRHAAYRQQLENLLYQEAPAHVLLRIIWLAPHDYCCFEKYHRQWIKWLAGQKSCAPFDWCGFLQFLFRRQYACLPEPAACVDCNQQPDNSPCTTGEEQVQYEDISAALLSQINTTFCWKDQHCQEYRFIPCEGFRDVPDTPDPILIRSAASDTTPAAPEASEPAAEIKEEQRPPSSAATPAATPKKKTKKTAAAGLDKAARSKFFEGRIARYRKEAAEIVGATKGAEPASALQEWLNNHGPDKTALEAVITTILAAKANKKNRLFTKKRVTTMLSIAVRYYLDHWAFNQRDMEWLHQSSDVFETIRQAKIDMADIYRQWESDALKKHYPAIDMNAVKHLLTGNK